MSFVHLIFVGLSCVLWPCGTHLLVLGIFCRFFGIFYGRQSCHLQNMDSFVSFFLICILSIFFSYLSALTRISSTMLKRIHENKPSCLVQILRGEGTQSSPLGKMLAVGFVDVLYNTEEVPLDFCFPGSFFFL